MHQFVDLSRFYIASDNELMIDILKGEINFLKSAWDLLGRPLVTLVLKRIHLGRSTSPLDIHIYIYICVYYIETYICVILLLLALITNFLMVLLLYMCATVMR